MIATVAGSIADYVGALITVYIVLILAYILTNVLFAFGMRPGYSRALNAVLEFLRDVSEPYLRIFRRFIKPIGMFDFSPLIAIFVLFLASDLITYLIRKL